MSSSNGTARPFRVLVIGGSYAGLSATLNLLDLCGGKAPRFTPDQKNSAQLVPIDITIVDERDGFYHLIGSPLALASEEYSSRAWTKFEDIPALRSPSVKWIQGSVKQIEVEQRIATIKNIATQEVHNKSYDYLIVASGLRRVWPVVPQSLTKKTYMFETSEHIHAVKNSADGVVVVGGGAVGIEMATEIKMISPNLDVTLIHSRDKLLSAEPLPDEFKTRALDMVRETGVKVLLGHRVLETTKMETGIGKAVWKLKLDNGATMTTGRVINAISKSIPTSSFLPTTALDSECYVRINDTLRFSSEIAHQEHHFAVGDIVAWPGIRRCGGAMGMGHYAAVNIHQHILSSLCGTTPNYVHWPEYPPMIALAVGHQSIMYTPTDGTKSGEDVNKACFGDDLGLTICTNYMQLKKESFDAINSTLDVEVVV